MISNTELFEGIGTQCQQFDSEIRDCIRRAIDKDVHPALLISVLSIQEKMLIDAIEVVEAK